MHFCCQLFVCLHDLKLQIDSIFIDFRFQLKYSSFTSVRKHLSLNRVLEFSTITRVYPYTIPENRLIEVRVCYLHEYQIGKFQVLTALIKIYKLFPNKK